MCFADFTPSSNARFPPAPLLRGGGLKRFAPRCGAFFNYPRGGDGGTKNGRTHGSAPTFSKLRSINAVRAATPGGPRCCFGPAPFTAVGVAVLGDPRFDTLRRWLNGIAFHIPRRGGPMCPPVPRCGTGTVPIKRKSGLDCWIRTAFPYCPKVI